METLETDYLVIGCGAVSMAFVDTMLSESDAGFAIVDRHHMPGGHWNDAYPFVRLHQPSAFYGVPSSELGTIRIDETGSNKGFYELASGAEVSAYFDKVMRERFLPSGRVRYFPMCDYLDDGRFRSLLSGTEVPVAVRRKIVDGTFFNTSVPSTHDPHFEVDGAAVCIPPNELPRRAPGHRQFVVLGGGKTAMDVIVWLLESGADPDGIHWVRPRDSWLINRETTQPGSRFARRSAGGMLAQLEAIIEATSVDDLFERFEKAGVMLRIDPAVRPDMFHYATISRGEVDQLRRIKNVVRGRHVVRIGGDRLVMDNDDEVPTPPQALHVDCTATAVRFKGAKSKPVFAGNRITLQALLAPLVATSAALTAFVEAHIESEAEKNRLCTPVELADTPTEWMQSFLGNLMNQNEWSRTPELRDWFGRCRLNPRRKLPGDSRPSDRDFQVMGEAISRNLRPAVESLQRLIAKAPAA